ncbi:MAG: hypothetical protein P1V20_08120 [Verrucomicrobiales bacterium]|nr:hypothetical protein [Verrucomicrobiales bacterium]
MNFPLQLSFPVLTIAQKISVTDADNQTVCFVRQKILKLKEAIEVFTDSTRSQKICDIKADRVLDFSANYHFYDCNGADFGAVARKGMKSIWRAHYDIMKDGAVDMNISEENPWVKMVDGMVGEIPIVGFFSGLMFHPSYVITNAATGQQLVRIKKRRAFFESRFSVEKLSEFNGDDELRIVMSILMMALLERGRG